jgi:hypothetical protein
LRILYRRIIFCIQPGAGWRERSVIAYSLRCHRGHEFDGWFRDSAAFDQQSGSGHLACPSCNSLRIEKAIMAPAVAGTKKSVRSKAGDAKQMQQFATGLRKYVQQNADYVGPNFAEEARKIHYGETPERHIYGEATHKEAQELIDEGVDVAPLPPDTEAAN